MARVVVAHIPHHVTQRGNRRMETFFCDDDYEEYIDLMAQACKQANTEVWDEQYLYHVVRYVERNPVAAKLCERPEQWRWPSAEPHLKGKDNQLVTVTPMLERISDWSAYLSEGDDEALITQMQQNLRAGRPLGDVEFMDQLEKLLGRTLRPKKPSPKPLDR